MNTVAAFLGRVLLAVIFIASGLGKLFDIAGTQTMLAAVGLPVGLAVPVALFELVGGLAVALGVLTRLFALLFAGFCLLTILFFHRDFADPVQSVMALKNLAIAGGFLCLFAHRQVVWSYDALRLRRRADLATHDAELRAARAEAREAALSKAAAAGTATGATPLVDSDGDGIADSLSYRRRRWWSF